MVSTILFYGALSIAALFYLRWTWRMRQRIVALQREQIDAAFLARQIRGPTDSLSLTPSDATLVHAKETIVGSNAIRVSATRLYKNPHGEYFLFICPAGETGFVKHLSSEEAMRALKPFKREFQCEFGEAGHASVRNES